MSSVDSGDENGRGQFALSEDDDTFGLHISASEDESTSQTCGKQKEKRDRKRAKPLRNLSSSEEDVSQDRISSKSPRTVSARNKNSTPHSSHCSTPIHSKSPRTVGDHELYVHKALLQEVLENQKHIYKEVKSLRKEVGEIKKDIETHQNQQACSAIIKVPLQIRNAVREGYTSGLDRGLSWQVEKKRLNDQVNEELNTYIRKFVVGLHTDVNPAVLNAALLRYFTSKKEDNNRTKKNKTEQHRTRQADYERKTEKVRRRSLSLQKKDWPEDKKAKYNKALKREFMSSDEEGPDGGLVSRPPSWQSDKFRNLKESLDTEYLRFCSPKSRRLLSKRAKGAPKTKTIPDDKPSDLEWIFKKTSNNPATSNQPSTGASTANTS